MTKTEMNMHRINLGAVAAYLSGKQEEPDDAPSQHRMAVNRALHDLERINKELEKVRAYNAVLIAVAKEQQMIYGDQGKIVGKLVRCKDCVHFAPENAEEGDSSGHCRNRYAPCENQTVDMWWFCADGEAKE